MTYKKQRKTKNLGLNRSKEKEKIYNYIEKKLGYVSKKCSRSVSEKCKYGFCHEGPEELPIRKFNLLKCGFKNGKFYNHSNSKIPLQSYCIDCERKYRKGRLNKNSNKFKKMNDVEIYNYYKKTYGKKCSCSKCKENKDPECFLISRRMEKGLHNICISCAKGYSEAVGSRWAIYSPEGRNRVSITKRDEKKYPGEILSKDHVWPLSKGGSDNKENIKIIPKNRNSSKSDTVPNFGRLSKIPKKIISRRYWGILNNAIEEGWELRSLDISLSKAVNKLIEKKNKMTDVELKRFFEKEKQKNNRKHSTDRAVRKFREFIKESVSYNKRN